MGQQIQNIAPSTCSCCGADNKYDGVLNTESVHEYKVQKEPTPENQIPDTQTPGQLSDPQHDALLKERYKYELQFKQLQQQLLQKDEALNQYKASQQKQIDEHNEFKQQTIQLMDAKAQLEQEITRLSEVVATSNNNNAQTADSTEITQLKANIEALQKERESLQQNESNSEDINTLTSKLQHLTHLLTTQQTENESLKLQLQQQNMNHSDQQMVMHQHIQITHAPVKYTGTSDANVVARNDTKYVSDLGSPHHVVNSADQIQEDPERRMLHALEKVSSMKNSKDLRGLILKQYKTVRFEDDELSSSESESQEAFEVQQEDSLKDSSVGSQEEIEIARANEVLAMKKEMIELQKQDEGAKKKEIKTIKVSKSMEETHMGAKQRTNSFSGSFPKSASVDTLGITPEPSQPELPEYTGSNLYRMSSHWEPHDVVKEKAEMQAAMAALMQNHLDSNRALDTYETV